MKIDRFAALQKKHFDTKRERYDVEKILNPPTHTILEIEEVMKLIPSEKRRIMDFGSGNGRLTIPLLKNGFRVTAVDISERSLIELKNVCAENGFKVNTKSSLKGISKLDAVVGCDVLHHTDMSKELNNIYKVLKKGGVVVFSEPNGFNPVWYLYIFLKGIFLVEKNIIYCNYFNIERILKKLNFKNVQIKGLGILPRSIIKNKSASEINDKLGNLPIIKLFSYRLIISAVR